MFYSYSGTIDVEDSDFNLFAECFIPRGKDEIVDEIAFDLSGKDEEYGRFTIQGVATRNEYNILMAPRIPLVYSNYNLTEQEFVSIKISQISERSANHICKVEGTWIQDGEEWKLIGRLKRTKQNKKG